jgi:predicted ATPase
MLLRSLKLTNFLSFGPDSKSIELGPLNVLIGPNGSGKSNLIEAIGLMKAAPAELSVPIREGGGVRDWLWKDGAAGARTASLAAVIAYPDHAVPLLYRFTFREKAQRFELSDERIQDSAVWDGDEPYRYFGYENGRPVLSVPGKLVRTLRPEDIHPEQSILSQRKDPDQYPEVTYLGEAFSQIRIYREWSLGRFSDPRMPQKADRPNDFLEENAKNLGLVLNSLRRQPAVKRRLLDELQALYEGIEDFDVRIEGGTVQVFLQEGAITVPATRLSDGTLRYLCLLAILCHPEPPPLICIEEPELGLHPDVLPSMAGLLREASERTQLVVTTHSDILVDALTDTPESVVVCEKHEGATRMRRLDQAELGVWLEKYSLGQLWTRGDIGGTRW